MASLKSAIFTRKIVIFALSAAPRPSFVQNAAIHHLNGGNTNDDHQLKKFYPWYTHDEYIEVAEEVSEELHTSRRLEAA